MERRRNERPPNHLHMLHVALLAAGLALPPAVYVERNSCPPDGCNYGKWTVRLATALYATPWRRTYVTQLDTDETVTAVRWEVHAIPLRGHVTATGGGFVKGDLIYMLTRLGNNTFKFWYRGRVVQANRTRASLDFGGRMVQENWWVFLRQGGSFAGWTDATGNFWTPRFPGPTPLPTEIRSP
jgi:hypothetical protein